MLKRLFGGDSFVLGLIERIYMIINEHIIKEIKSLRGDKVLIVFVNKTQPWFSLVISDVIFNMRIKLNMIFIQVIDQIIRSKYSYDFI